MRVSKVNLKISLSALVLFASIFPIASINAADSAIDEQFQVQKAPGPGYTGYLVNNSRSQVKFDSFLASFNGADKADRKVSAMKKCSSLAACEGPFILQVADINLTLCNNPLEENCIRGVKTTNLATKAISNTFIPRPELTADFGAAIKGDPKFDLPNGGNPLIFSLPDAPHVGGDLYLIKSDFFATRKSANAKFKLDLISTGIYPVTIESGNYQAGGPHLEPERYIGQPILDQLSLAPPYLGGRAHDPRCLMATKKICIFPQAFPEGFSFQLSLRANQGFTSWLYGRLANPAITVTKAKVDQRAVVVTIDAEPLKVPVVYGWVPNSALPADMLAKYDKSRSGTIYQGADRFAPLDTISILKGKSDNYDEQGIDEFLSWMPLLGDKAVALPSQWSFQTLKLKSNTAAEITKCTNSFDSLAGLIFTNASVYSAGAPEFDATTGSLDYKLAAPHTKANGDLVTGTYDLIINSDVARCLYGFTKAPIGANVSVISNDGQIQVATTIIKEQDGFMRMGAYGFGFSSPTIKMKITQPGAAAAAKTAITCVKGTTIKKVVEVNPVCPAGFKKQ
jgi:hypothetical protein